MELLKLPRFFCLSVYYGLEEFTLDYIIPTFNPYPAECKIVHDYTNRFPLLQWFWTKFHPQKSMTEQRRV